MIGHKYYGRVRVGTNTVLPEEEGMPVGAGDKTTDTTGKRRSFICLNQKRR
jgi:hypothetical protein